MTLQPDEDFSDEMKARARELGVSYQMRCEDLWDDEVIFRLAMEFPQLTDEAVEILAADYA